MKTKRVKGVTHWATVAIRLSVLLVGQFNDGPRANPVRTANLFARLRRVMKALPPNHILPPNFEENMARWPQTWGRGEHHAARYQMVLLVRRLRRYRADWGTPLMPVSVPARSPEPNRPAEAERNHTLFSGAVAAQEPVSQSAGRGR